MAESRNHSKSSSNLEPLPLGSKVTYQQLNSENTSTITIKGQVDTDIAPKLGELLAGAVTAGKIQIILDLGGIEYMSSAALSEILMYTKKTVRMGGGLLIANPSDRVRELLDLDLIKRYQIEFKVFPTIEEAEKSFPSQEQI